LFNSDGDTPQKQAEQIIGVTPILQGQKSSENHVIPGYQPQQQSQSQQQPKQAPADLIDFGQNESFQPAKEANPEMLNQPSNLQAVQTKSGGQGQKDIEQMLSSVNTARGQGQGPLLDFHDDMHNSLLQMTLKRSDTSEDEFVDAEE